MTAFNLPARLLTLRPLLDLGATSSRPARLRWRRSSRCSRCASTIRGTRASHFAYAAARWPSSARSPLRAPREGDAPRAYESALLAATFALAVPTLARLALILGSDGLDSSGTLIWAGAALAALGSALRPPAARSCACCSGR